MPDCSQCLNHSAHQRAIDVHDKRLNAHSNDIEALRECIVRLTTLEEQSVAWRNDADARLDALEAIPASRWEKIVSTVITGLVSAIVGAAVVVFSIGGAA